MLTWIYSCKRLRFFPSEVDKLVGVRFLIAIQLGFWLFVLVGFVLGAPICRSFGMKYAGFCFLAMSSICC